MYKISRIQDYELVKFLFWLTTRRGKVQRLLLLIFKVLLVGFITFLPTISIAKTQDATVKVFTTSKNYNYDTPWQVNGYEEGSGSGAIISGHRILTNAHVVGNAGFIEVQRNGDSKKYVAEVQAISHEADLALLQVAEEQFFSNISFLEIGQLPELLDSVVVYGFPEGGEGLSVTKGVVSRIEVTEYAHSKLQFLTLQIDAAINSGNSGGPVIMDGKIIGVAMQSISKAENIGYIIPTPIIDHFLTDLQDGHYDGFPSDGIYAQSLENSTLRTVVGLLNDETGVYICNVIPGTSADGLLYSGDVILEIDGQSVANDGTIQLRLGLQLNSDYLISSHQVGDRVEFTVLRKGQKQKILVPLKTKAGQDLLVRPTEYDVYPEYYILSGLVLMPLSYNYMATWGEDWVKDAPVSLLSNALKVRERAGEEVVIIGGVLKTKMTTGYEENALNARVVAVNGTKVVSFQDATALVDKALMKDDPILLKLEDHSVIAISPREHKENEKSLLDLYGIGASKRVKTGVE